MAISPWGSPPTLDSATYSNDGTALTFTAPSLLSDQTVTSYDYEISTDGGATADDGTGEAMYSTLNYVGDYGNTSPTSSPYIDPYGVDYCPYGTACSYRIRAEIGSDTFQTPWSAWVAISPWGSPPTLDSATYSDDGTALTFTAPSLLSDQTVTSYDYEISTDGGATADYGPEGPEATSTAPSTTLATTATPVPRRARTSIHTELITVRRGRVLLSNPGRDRKRFLPDAVVVLGVGGTPLAAFGHHHQRCRPALYRLHPHRQ